MSGKLKKKFFMKPNNLFKFFVNFFYSIKNIYFPDILPHFKQKKNFLYISKKKSSRDIRYSRKIFVQQSLFKIFFYSKLRNMSGKLKKKISWSRITYLNFLWNFFTQLKIYIFPIYYSILNKKKSFYIFRKKNPATMLRYSRKNFVQ